MTKKIVWRLGKLPTPDEVSQLVKDKIITQDEAREILFKSEDYVDRDSDSLKDEIKFLRELVDKLSANMPITKIVETIKYVDRPYHNYPWYQPYVVWCGSPFNTTTGIIGVGTTTITASSGSTNVTSGNNSFTSINTF